MRFGAFDRCTDANEEVRRQCWSSTLQRSSGMGHGCRCDLIHVELDDKSRRELVGELGKRAAPPGLIATICMFDFPHARHLTPRPLR